MGTSSSSSEVISYTLPAELKHGVRQASEDWDQARSTARLWSHDASLWTGSDERQWLGWLDVINRQLLDTSKFKALSAEVKEDGFNHIVVLGDDHASVAADAFQRTFGKQAACPELLTLRSFDPEQISDFRAAIDPLRTLFFVSSQDALLEYFYEEAKRVAGEQAGHHFLAVIGPNSDLELTAVRLGFHRVYYGDRDVRDRFGAFTNAGMLPCAAAGYNAEKLLRRTRQMAEACRSEHAMDNPGVSLGLVLGTAAVSFGRNKVTLICSQEFGLDFWIEDLIAGPGGLVPVRGEPVLAPDAYAPDRIFVYLKYARDHERSLEQHVTALEQAGLPVVRLIIEDRYDVGQCMFQWQIATVVAAAVMRKNPFAATAEDIREAQSPIEREILSQAGIQLFADDSNAIAVVRGHESLGGMLRHHLDRLSPEGYFGVLPYFPLTPEYDEIFRPIRRQLMESKQNATTVGFLPEDRDRLNAGVFIQITRESAGDLAVPDSAATFRELALAKAQSDLRLLQRQDGRVLRLHLNEDLSKSLCLVRDLICAAVEH